MKKLLIFTAALLLAAPTFAQAPLPGADDLFMAAPTDKLPKLEKCDTLHHEQSCNRYHVVEASTSISAGSILSMERGDFRVDWAGEGFRLNDGTVVSQVSTVDGQTWQQVYPKTDTVEVSGWTDTDGSSYLSIGDTITVEGMPVTVTDHRFYLWMSPTD